MRKTRTPTLYMKAWKIRLGWAERERKPALITTAEWLRWTGKAIAPPYFVSRRLAEQFVATKMRELKTVEAMRETLRELEQASA